MLHMMKLKLEPFEQMRSGAKTIELRLNDEKRQQVKVGDHIEFTLIDDSSQKLLARVIALHHFNSFRELYAAFPKGKFGYLPNEVIDPDNMDAYYPREEQEKYGALGIEICIEEVNES